MFRSDDNMVLDVPRRDEIADFILKEIMSGALRFGQKISENSYSSRLGVSRTPVREAIVSLRSLGLITVRPRSGSYVITFTKDTLAELFDVRRLLESGGVKMASDSQRRTLVGELLCYMEDLRTEVHNSQEFDAFSSVDTEFHTALVRSCRNPLILSMYRPVEVCAQAVRSRLPKNQDVVHRANKHHADIIDAITNGDLTRFEATLQEHLDWVLGMLMDVDELFERSCPPPQSL